MPVSFDWSLLEILSIFGVPNEPDAVLLTAIGLLSIGYLPIQSACPRTEKYFGGDYTEGVDISWWKNVKTAASFFAYDLKEDFMGGYDHGSQSGTVHIGDHNIVKGVKLWEWGSGARGQATEGRLT